MSNEISVKQTASAVAPTTQQTGTTNFNVNNENGGIVNFISNYNYPQNTPEVSAEQLMAIQSFSKEYYQLIVTCEDNVFADNIEPTICGMALGYFINGWVKKDQVLERKKVLRIFQEEEGRIAGVG